MAADGRCEKNGDGTHYFSCYLRWYDTVTTTRSQRLMACCHARLLSRREANSIASLPPNTATNGTLERTACFQLRKSCCFCCDTSAQNSTSSCKSWPRALPRAENERHACGELYLCVLYRSDGCRAASRRPRRPRTKRRTWAGAGRSVYAAPRRPAARRPSSKQSKRLVSHQITSSCSPKNPSRSCTSTGRA